MFCCCFIETVIVTYFMYIDSLWNIISYVNKKNFLKNFTKTPNNNYILFLYDYHELKNILFRGQFLSITVKIFILNTHPRGLAAWITLKARRLGRGSIALHLGVGER